MKKAYIYAGIAILLWSSLATVSKMLLGSLSSYQVLWVSALFAALALLVVSVGTGRAKVMKQYRLRDYGIMVAIGLPGSFVYYVLYFLGTARLQASQAFTINYLWPIMSVVFACILLGEKMTLRKGVAIGLSFLGVVTVAGSGLANFSPSTLVGVLLVVGAAVSYGAFTALNQKWHYDKYISLMVSFFATFVLSLLIQLLSGKPMELNVLQLAGMGWNGIAVMAVATVCWALALDMGDTAKISNLAYITPFLSLVWTFLILKEAIDPWSVAGLGIIVLGIFIQLKDNNRNGQLTIDN